MGIPLRCSGCNETVGLDNRPFLFRIGMGVAEVKCPGKGKHLPPVRTSKRRLFGLVERVTLEYPETRTTSSWIEYVGPKHPFLIWLAIMFTKGHKVRVNDTWCLWSFWYGLEGGGLKNPQSV